MFSCSGSRFEMDFKPVILLVDSHCRIGIRCVLLICTTPLNNVFAKIISRQYIYFSLAPVLGNDGPCAFDEEQKVFFLSREVFFF
jgi:hypothetical protein